jgi:hypothetical protein
MLGFFFHEVMEGTVTKAGDRFDRPFRFELDVRAPSVLGFVTTAVGDAEGSVRIDGLAKHAPAKGYLELSPILGQRIRYVFDFTGDDGKTYHFEGSKKTSLRRHLVGWTTLPGKVFAEDGSVWGDALLRFHLRRDLRALVRSIRFSRRMLARAQHA